MYLKGFCDLVKKEITSIHDSIQAFNRLKDAKAEVEAAFPGMTVDDALSVAVGAARPPS